MGPSGEQEHLCGSCVAGSGVTSCPKHGPDFIEYKCTFCCKKAAFFCKSKEYIAFKAAKVEWITYMKNEAILVRNMKDAGLLSESWPS